VKAKTRYLHVQGTDAAPYLDRIAVVEDTAGYTPVTADVKLQPAVVVRGQLVNKATGRGVRGEAFWLPLQSNTPIRRGETDHARLYSHQTSTRPAGTHAATAADGKFTLRVPPGPGVVLARCDRLDPAAVFTPARVRDEDRTHLKTEKNPDAIAVGPRDRGDEEYFDTVFFTSPIRWENGYTIVNPNAKAKTVEVKIEFDPGTTVTLTATDPDGKPLSGVTVVGPGTLGRTPPTFATPEITVGGIDPKGRPVQLYLLHKERKQCAELTLKGDEKGPVAVKLVPCGNVTGRVVDHTGQPVKDARVMFQMTDAVADDLLRQKLYRGAAEVSTDADGKFTFPRLFPDVEFGVYVSIPGFRSGAAFHGGITLKPGEVKDVGELKCRDPKKIDGE
jgi:Carboxypeptidase regulatory-like domain